MDEPPGRGIWNRSPHKKSYIIEIIFMLKYLLSYLLLVLYNMDWDLSNEFAIILDKFLRYDTITKGHLGIR